MKKKEFNRFVDYCSEMANTFGHEAYSAELLGDYWAANDFNIAYSLTEALLDRIDPGLSKKRLKKLHRRELKSWKKGLGKRLKNGTR